MPEQAVLSIRAARPNDLAAVKGLLREASLPTEGLQDQFGENYVVAALDGALVAAIGIEVYPGSACCGRRWSLRRTGVPGWATS